MKVIALLAMLVMLGAGLGWTGSSMAQEFKVPFAANQYMFDKINEFRKQNGLGRLKAHFGPGTIADEYSLFLARNNTAGHEDDGLGPMGRMQAGKDKERSKRLKANFNYCSIYENIAAQWTEPNQQTWQQAIDQAMEFWKNSPGHRANMLSNSTHMGTGIHGWRFGNRWYYKEVMVFVDRSCL